MKEFKELWGFANRHGKIQQEYSELKHVFDLTKDCSSYLEIGTAEGGSICVLGHGKKEVTYIDIDEDHTRAQRLEALASLGVNYKAIHGNTHNQEVIKQVDRPYDVVFIDAGHDYEDVKQDANNYGVLATKFILFHDVQLPPVRRAFEEFSANYKNVSIFINSDTYGMGIITL